MESTFPNTELFAFQRNWICPQFPLSNYPALSRAWNDSRVRIHEIRRLLSQVSLPAEILCVGVAGSLARMEATAASDCDLLVVLKPDVIGGSDMARMAFDSVWQALSPLSLERPEVDGIYAGAVTHQGLFDPATIGQVSEDPRAFGFRITFLLELQPVFGDAAFHDVSRAIVERYAHRYVACDPAKQWTYLLNDLVRYFKALCQTYLFAELPEDRRWRLRNLKARHSRLLMYAGLLFLLGESSRITHDKQGWLASRLNWTPLERLAMCYQEYRDPGFAIIAGGLDRFVEAMATPGFRDRLAETQPATDLLNREANPDYQRLKQSADTILSELLRFAMARQGDWAERFFEYWLF